MFVLEGHWLIMVPTIMFFFLNCDFPCLKKYINYYTACSNFQLFHWLEIALFECSLCKCIFYFILFLLWSWARAFSSLTTQTFIPWRSWSLGHWLSLHRALQSWGNCQSQGCSQAESAGPGHPCLWLWNFPLYHLSVRQGESYQKLYGHLLCSAAIL